MITIALIIAHAFSNNNHFRPESLYFGTLIADIMIVGAVAGGI